VMKITFFDDRVNYDRSTRDREKASFSRGI